jgi:hypothetical protein
MGVPVNSAWALGLRVVDGYNPLELKTSAEIKRVPFPVLARLTGLRRLVFGQEVGDIPGYRKVLQEPLVYESVDPLPPVYAPARWEVVPEGAARLAAFQAPGFDPYRVSLLESAAPGWPVLPAFPKPPVLGYRLLREGPNHQVWSVTAPAPVLAVFSEAAYPDWKAAVDGSPVPLLRANHAFRAVTVPAGTHQVEFHFIPSWRRFLLPGLLAYLGASALLLLLPLRRTPTA